MEGQTQADAKTKSLQLRRGGGGGGWRRKHQINVVYDSVFRDELPFPRIWFSSIKYWQSLTSFIHCTFAWANQYYKSRFLVHFMFLLI